MKKVEPIVIKTNDGVISYCKKNDMKLSEFNLPVVLSPDIQYCDELFFGCTSFNQHVTIPNGVISCNKMFKDCKSFNHPIIIPESVLDITEMFMGCESMTQELELGDNIRFFENAILNSSIKHFSLSNDTVVNFIRYHIGARKAADFQ